ncbi:MAG: FAD-binding oxidoreductase [Thermoleophilia bacterium]|jgi:FAD/FMN-containing dehydrogenase
MLEKQALADIVGAENVSDDPDILSGYAADESFVHPITPRCVVRPKDTEEVQQIINWANTSATPLIPVSSGPPHYRGDTVPSVGGAVIVDMRRLNKIVRLDLEHRIVMVEPGVTFGELIPAARDAGLRLNLPLLPRPTKSVVGSTLEREPVIMPKYHWDISDPLACTQVVYGTGDTFKTGSAAGPGTLDEQWAIGAAQNEAAGPIQADFLRLIQGSQGTMGIVTWATVRCEHLPTIEEPYLVGSDKLHNLLEFTHWLIRNRWADDCLLLNDTNLARIMARDWPADYERLKSELPRWILFYTISGTNYFPEEKIAYLQKDIATVAQSIRVNPLRSVGTVSAFELMKTLHEPSTDSYWKSKGGSSSTDIFFITIYEKLNELICVMEETAVKHDQKVSDIGIYLQPLVQGVNYHCEFNIFFDKTDAKETAQVAALSEAAVHTLSARGAFFSRPYGPWADTAYRRDAATTIALRKVKSIFDPNNVMNPGKLCF